MAKQEDQARIKQHAATCFDEPLAVEVQYP